MEKPGIIRKQIPNAITLMNLLSGSLAVIFVLGGNVPVAAMLLALSAVFDFFDGFIARLLGVSSGLGRELDSLADVISFGLAPSLFLFELLRHNPGSPFSGMAQELLPYSALLIAAFSAYRLAVFNLDTRQHNSFIGLPTPANAILLVSLALASVYDTGILSRLAGSYWLQLAVIPFSSFMLVSNIPMIALKFSNGYGFKQNMEKYLLLALCIAILLIFKLGGLVLIIPAYILVSFFTLKR